MKEKSSYINTDVISIYYNDEKTLIFILSFHAHEEYVPLNLLCWLINVHIEGTSILHPYACSEYVSLNFLSQLLGGHIEGTWISPHHAY